jgi:hypothetical protein
MTFLQPFILWGLPLILVPVIIHLINRMRHRRQKWAAMRFLISATHSSVSHAKLRQFLILLFRVMAVLMLLLFLSRPLAGGWVGWMFSPAPDAIVILLDRSASMETRLAGTEETRREYALRLLSQTAREFEESSRLALIDSATRIPQPFARAETMVSLPQVEATDTAADIPSLFQSAFHWLTEQQAGAAEIWIASDMQRSNWQPEDTRWEALREQFGALPQRVRIRLLALNQPSEKNLSVALREVSRTRRGQDENLRLLFDFLSTHPENQSVPVSLTLNGAPSQLDLQMDGQAFRWRHIADPGSEERSGWGKLEIPADSNARDNTAYFVYGAEQRLRAAVISEQEEVSRLLAFAAAAWDGERHRMAERERLARAGELSWDNRTLLVWQGALPEGQLADQLHLFAEEGGRVIFFPPGHSGPQRFLGFGWGEVEQAEETAPFRIARWDEEQGPLGRTDEGFSLPLSQTIFQKRQAIAGARNRLAAFTDGAPFLVRQTVGQGEVYFCSSLPLEDWSSLGEGPVLVPMLQRLLQSGARRLQQTAAFYCGELSRAELARPWTPVDSDEDRDIRFHAGVYQAGDRLLALNRPPAEDDLERVQAEEAETLFGGLPFQWFEDRRRREEPLQGEFWRFFLAGMLIFLMVESFLVLPARSEQGEAKIGRRGRPRQWREASA